MPSDIFTISLPVASALSDVEDSGPVYDEDATNATPLTVPGYKDYRYVSFGTYDDLPYKLLNTIGSDEVLSQNLFFNILTAYGAGLRYVDTETGKASTMPGVKRFMLSNSMPEFFLEQCTDMKHFFFAVAVIILNREGTAILRVVHKDACYCRFEKADAKGRINHVFFANWRKRGSLGKNDVEVLQLLDEKNPLGNLEVLMGRAPGADGVQRMRTRLRKFAVVMRFPTPGQRYYPVPYYTSLFRGDWYDIKRLIGKGKKAKIKNHATVRYQVEVHADYWKNLVMENHATADNAKAEAIIKKEKNRIKDFVMGVHNSGKTWISGYYTDSYGKEVRMVRINVIDMGKEGGDWAEDTQEASNMLCYGTNIHPNLVGAVPGKGQANNSGSDKRELFTLKQSLETAFHDILLKVHELIIFFNGWEGAVRPEVPLVMLTTLDTHTDAVKVSPETNNEQEINS